MTSNPHLQFSISAGELTSFDATGTQSPVGPAYSGAPGFVNDPTATALVAQGPIPVGLWSIGAPYHDHETGLFTLSLTPLPSTDTFGRSEFKLHGADAAKDVDGAQASSRGCIVAPHPERVVAATFQLLEVIP